MRGFAAQEAERGLPTSCRLPVAGSLMFQGCLVLISPIYLFGMDVFSVGCPSFWLPFMRRAENVREYHKGTSNLPLQKAVSAAAPACRAPSKHLVDNGSLLQGRNVNKSSTSDDTDVRGQLLGYFPHNFPLSG